MIGNANDASLLTWESEEEPESEQRHLAALYAWTHADVSMLNVKLSPDAGFAAVQKLLPQERYESSSVDFFDTRTWHRRGRCKVRMPPGGNVIHRVEISFVSEEKFILTDVDITMYERDRVVWEAAVSVPPWPAEWPYLPEYEPWRIVASAEPTLASGLLFVPVHWARILQPARWEPAVWQDRYAVEVISIADGSWVRRLEDDEVPPTPNSISIEIEDGRARCMDGSNVLATLVPPTGRRITAADVSLRAQRALVVLDARQLVFLELPPK
jgi:hypothetical protein